MASEQFCLLASHFISTVMMASPLTKITWSTRSPSLAHTSRATEKMFSRHFFSTVVSRTLTGGG